jgi:aldehyde:ferredoxin oxidoreductase
MLGPEILGIPKMIDRFASKGKSGILLNLQHLSAVFDSATICKFAGFAFGEEVLSRLLSAAMGESLAAQDLLRSGERIWNLERLWNNAAGFSRMDDTLPTRVLSEPHREGPSAGRTVDLPPMLDEYYRARGWDAAGMPTEAKIAALGLEDAAARLLGLTADLKIHGDTVHPAWQAWRPAVAEAERLRAAERGERAQGDIHPPEGGRHLRAVP